jgi:hypothetical protein
LPEELHILIQEMKNTTKLSGPNGDKITTEGIKMLGTTDLIYSSSYCLGS